MLNGRVERGLIGLAVVLAAVFANAQSYGDLEQTLTIGGAAFRSLGPGEEDPLFSDGYFSGDGVVPLDVPDGARIEQVCVYGVNAIEPGFAFAQVDVIKLVPAGGGAPVVRFVDGSLASISTSVGYQLACSPPLGFTVRSQYDVDDDGSPDDVAYVVAAGSDVASAVGGVQIRWRRQVSPPPAAPTFLDVPETDGAWPQVEALAASGVTTGCGNGDYCPDATLTRRQMAVFLAKALGLHWGS
jgi:hypothetical protein